MFEECAGPKEAHRDCFFRSIEVRDSGTGHLIPVRYGMGSGQMGELSARHRCRRHRRQCHLEIQVDILARELYFQVFLDNLISDQRYLDIDTPNPHSIWIHFC